MMGVLWERVVAVMVGVAPPLRFAKGRISPPLPVIPADAGIQGHKNNRLPRALRPPRSAFAGAAWVCFTLGSRVRGNDVAVAGMTEVSPE